jgi:hypothetical protein
MAKRKVKFVDLRKKNLEFTKEGITYKLLAFKAQAQSVDIAIYEDGEFIKESEMAFAHIPKELKRLVRPL